LRRPVAKDEYSELGRRVSFLKLTHDARASSMAPGRGSILGGKNSSIELDADPRFAKVEI
jgi:hypothetical protein